EWFILDWKTNRIDSDELDKLRVSYRPQIAAYWNAVTEMTRQTVAAGIYSTATGKVVGYDEKELTAEWDRLRNLQRDDFAAEINHRVWRAETGQRFSNPPPPSLWGLYYLNIFFFAPASSLSFDSPPSGYPRWRSFSASKTADATMTRVNHLLS